MHIPNYLHRVLIKGCLIDERQYWCNFSGIVFQEPGKNRIKSSGFMEFHCFEKFSHACFTYCDIWQDIVYASYKVRDIALASFRED